MALKHGNATTVSPMLPPPMISIVSSTVVRPSLNPAPLAARHLAAIECECYRNLGNHQGFRFTTNRVVSCRVPPPSWPLRSGVKVATNTTVAAKRCQYALMPLILRPNLVLLWSSATLPARSLSVLRKLCGFESTIIGRARI
jgi:hypothetical protein